MTHARTYVDASDLTRALKAARLLGDTERAVLWFFEDHLRVEPYDHDRWAVEVPAKGEPFRLQAPLPLLYHAACRLKGSVSLETRDSLTLRGDGGVQLISQFTLDDHDAHFTPTPPPIARMEWRNWQDMLSRSRGVLTSSRSPQVDVGLEVADGIRLCLADGTQAVCADVPATTTERTSLSVDRWVIWATKLLVQPRLSIQEGRAVFSDDRMAIISCETPKVTVGPTLFERADARMDQEAIVELSGVRPQSEEVLVDWSDPTRVAEGDGCQTVGPAVQGLFREDLLGREEFLGLQQATNWDIARLRFGDEQIAVWEPTFKYMVANRD